MFQWSWWGQARDFVNTGKVKADTRGVNGRESLLSSNGQSIMSRI